MNPGLNHWIMDWIIESWLKSSFESLNPALDNWITQSLQLLGFRRLFSFHIWLLSDKYVQHLRMW